MTILGCLLLMDLLLLDLLFVMGYCLDTFNCVNCSIEYT